MPRDIVARYEKLRRSAVDFGLTASYELTILRHDGIPGWLEFVRRYFLSPPRYHVTEPARDVRNRGPLGNVQQAVVRTTPDEVVRVLSSIVSNCLGGSQ